MSHRADSLIALLYPQLDLCSLYVFPGSIGTTLVMTVNPPPGGPGGFYPDGQYAFHIDRTGDGIPDLTLRATFSDELRGRQLVQLRQLDGYRASNRNAAGKVIASGMTDALIQSRAGVWLWAGAAADPDWMHDGILSAARECIAKGQPFDPYMGYKEISRPAMNAWAHSNVQALVIELPPSMLGTDEIRVWATTAMPHGAQAGWTQVSRGAIPLLAALFDIDSNAAAGPADDPGLYGDVIRSGAARAARALGSAADPAEHGDRVAAALLPDVLTYRPDSATHFGPDARNGRGLRDPAAEAVLSLTVGTYVPLGLGAGSATGHLRADFPYLAAPVDATGPPDLLW